MAESSTNLGRSIGAVVLGYLGTVLLTMGMHGIIQYSAPGAYDPTGETVPTMELQILMLSVSFFIAIAGGWLAGFVAGTREVAHALALGTFMALLGFIMAFTGREEMRMYSMILAIIALPGVTLGGYMVHRWQAGRRARSAERENPVRDRRSS